MIRATAVRYPDGTIGLFTDHERAMQAAAKARGTVHQLVEVVQREPGSAEPWHLPHMRGMPNDSEGGTHD